MANGDEGANSLWDVVSGCTGKHDYFTVDYQIVLTIL